LGHLQPAESVPGEHVLRGGQCAERCHAERRVSVGVGDVDLGVPYVRTYFSIPVGERAELMVSSLWPDVVRFLPARHKLLEGPTHGAGALLVR
jgi:hypothetical protein